MNITYDSLTALLTLTAMETVLGIDNIVFISILAAKLPEGHREKTRKIGIILALVLRVILLFSISWIMALTAPLFDIFQHSFSGRDLILIFGGIFLIGKSTFEIHHKIEGDPEVHLPSKERRGQTVLSVLAQILILDLVFSLDSVITAVGMAKQISIMIIAMCISMLIMLFSAKSIGHFVERHPTIKILALSFLLLIGAMLTAEGFGNHINKGYIYFAMAFSFLVELANMRYRKRHKS